MTDFRAKGTIMGPAGLTAVFGMGTGVTPPVWSPEMYPAGGQAGPGTFRSEVCRTRSRTVGVMSGLLHDISSKTTFGSQTRSLATSFFECPTGVSGLRCSAPIGVVKPLGC